MMSRFIDGRHLRAARTMANLSQAQLAAIARIHVGAVKYWERRDGGLAGWAVERMTKALAAHNVVAGTISEGGRTSAFVRRG